MAVTYTHKDLARLLNVSETTIKSYRRKFVDCIPVASDGKPIRFSDAAYKVCRSIRDLFHEGMSVEAARDRLAQEFAWITPQTPASADTEASLALSPDLAQSISSLAKSMVTILQQQTAIMKRIQAMEAHLGGVAAASGADRSAPAGGPAPAENDRLNQLMVMMEKLSRVVARHMAGLGADGQGQAAQKDSEGTKIYRFPSAVPEPPQAAPPIPELPRHLETLPLVARSAQGAYVSAGARGHLTLNDLKALLAHNAYTVRWDYAPQEGVWRLVAEKDGEDLRVQLQELREQNGISRALVVRYSVSGEARHPLEICAQIAKLTGGGAE